jgi:hypothetical protein
MAVIATIARYERGSRYDSAAAQSTHQQRTRTVEKKGKLERGKKEKREWK